MAIFVNGQLVATGSNVHDVRFIEKTPEEKNEIQPGILYWKANEATLEFYYRIGEKYIHWTINSGTNPTVEEIFTE